MTLRRREPFAFCLEDMIMEAINALKASHCKQGTMRRVHDSRHGDTTVPRGRSVRIVLDGGSDLDLYEPYRDWGLNFSGAVGLYHPSAMARESLIYTPDQVRTFLLSVLPLRPSPLP